MKLRKNKKNFIISLVTALMLVMTMMPGMAFATGGTDDQNLVPYDEISKYEPLASNTSSTIVLNSGTLTRNGQWWKDPSGTDMVSQYFYHGAEIENGSGLPELNGIVSYKDSNGKTKYSPSSIENLYNPYYKKNDIEVEYDYNYTILTENTSSPNNGWKNYILEKLDANDVIKFGVMYAGSGMAHLLSDAYLNDFIRTISIYEVNNNGGEDKKVNEISAEKFDIAMDFDTADEKSTVIYQYMTNYEKVIGINDEKGNFVKPEYGCDKDKNEVNGTGREIGGSFHFAIRPGTLQEGQAYRLHFASETVNKTIPEIDFYFTTSVPATGVTLSKTSTTLYKGQTEDLTATVAPENATDKTVVWTSSNENVAAVKDGKVTAIGLGTAKIKAATKDGKFSAECTVSVNPVKVSKVKVNASKATIAVGSTKTLKASVYPSNAENKAVTWKSSNSKIAKVSSTGKVTAVKPGKATVTVTTKDGSFKAKTVINVIPKSTTFKLYAKKHSIAIKYKKIKGVSGYEIYRASSKDGKYKKIKTRLQKYPDTYTSIWLKSNKTYYYKIRTYKTVDGKKIYSKFSEVKKIKTKK